MAKEAVKTALLMNFLIFIAKACAAVVTGSAGMAAEAAHSFADTGNQILMLIGIKSSRRKADENHPFGHGKREYLISFIVGENLMALGALYSIYEGVHRLLHPEPLKYPFIGIAILLIGFVLDGYSWYVARKELDCTMKETIQELRDSKDASLITIFIEDTGAIIGLGVALLGTVLSLITGNPVYDAISSIIIGMLLGACAYFLIRETLSLAEGEAIELKERRYIRRVLNRDPRVTKVGNIKTQQMGNNSCIVCADVDFKDDLLDGELDVIIEELSSKIRVHLPDAHYIYLQPKKL